MNNKIIFASLLLVLNCIAFSKSIDTLDKKILPSDSVQYLHQKESKDSASTVHSDVINTKDSSQKNQPISPQSLITGLLISAIVGIFALLCKRLLRLIRIRYKRYVKKILLECEKTEGYFELIIGKITEEQIDEPTEKQKEEYSLFHILEEQQSIHIIGKPGSGKTCALQMAVQEISKNYLNDTYSKVPIYLKYESSINIFERIIDLLHKNDLVSKKEYIDELWLRDELKKGRFIFLIDDVHKSLLSETYRKDLRHLFEYQNNVFIIAGRDYVRHSDFNFNLYEVKPLDETRLKMVISLYLDNENDVDNLFRSVYYNYKLRSLYDTPQLATFLAKVYKKHGKIPLNKSKMFQEFWTLRNETDKLNTNIDTRLELLSSLAFTMINTPETKYSVTKNECYRIINRKITELHSIGKKAGDAEDELNKILIAGFLLNTERGIAFEHDQWFEYFAAIEVFANALPITGLPDTDTINELLYFATGMFDTSSVIKDEQKYLNFIKELSDRNIAVFNWCMDNFNKHERATLTEMTELRKGDRYSLNDIEIKYRNIINSYCHLSSLHFPDLSKKFYPNPHLKVGALVGIVEYDVVHNYGLRQITEGEEKDVLIFTRDDKDKLSNDYFLNLVLKSSTAALPYLCMICRNKLLQELYFQK